MADLSLKQHIRSISLPSRSNSSTRIQVSKSPSSSQKPESLCDSLSDLEESLKCINEEILGSSSLRTRSNFLLSSNEPTENLVTLLLEDSVKYIDMCSNTREAVIALKQSLRELQTALRRGRVLRDGIRGLVIERFANAYFLSRKKMNKQILRYLTDLKSLGTLPVPNSDVIATRVLKEASSRTATTIQSMLMFLLVKKNTSNRWSLVSKLVPRWVVEVEGDGENMCELEKVEFELRNLVLFHHGLRKDKVANAEELILPFQRKMEDLEVVLEVLEHGLEKLIRCLIDMRVSLLNIISHH